MKESKYKPRTSRISEKKTIAILFNTIYFTCVYNKQNVEANAYSMEERHVAEGIVIIEEYMDELIYVLESIV